MLKKKKLEKFDKGKIIIYKSSNNEIELNDYLYRKSGGKKINNNALTTLALLIAEGNFKEKEQVTALVEQLIK